MGQANTPDMLEGRTHVTKAPFTFHCHPGVSCYLKCCHNVEMYLFPYDVLRLKQRLNLHSAQFIRQHTRLGEGSHPFFPGVMLNMASLKALPCPFLSDEGCTVYTDRPSACRTYPLERAVEHLSDTNRLRTHYFMTHHPYCKGHFEKKTYTTQQWERDQGLHEFNVYNELWAEVDALFASNPWCGEGEAGPLQQLAFMVCYNIDDFRSYTEQHKLVQQFALDKATRNRIKKDDAALLKFGFQWLQYYLGRKPTLIPK